MSVGSDCGSGIEFDSVCGLIGILFHYCWRDYCLSVAYVKTVVVWGVAFALLDFESGAVDLTH